MSNTSNNTRKRRTFATKQAVEVRFSDRGFAFAKMGNSDYTGIIPLYTAAERPKLTEVPQGVLIFNKDTQCLELSDPDNNLWIPICGGGSVISSGNIGTPTDGTYTDGAVALQPTDTIADAIDAINEYLTSCCVLSYASHLGSTDGSTNGNLQLPSLGIGRVSSPNSPGTPFYAYSWDNDTDHRITDVNSLVWELATGEKITDLQTGTINIKFYDGNNSLINSETLTLNGTLSDQASSPNGYIQVTNLANNALKIEGRVKFNIPSNILLSGKSGYLRVEVVQTVGLNVYNNTPLEFFKDAAGAPSFLSQSVSLVSTPIKYLSGVKFGTISGGNYPVINFSTAVSNIWNTTYVTSNILTVNSNALGIPNFNVAYNSSFITKAGITPPAIPFRYSHDFIYSEDKNLTSSNVINPPSNGVFGTINFTARDPFNIVNSSPLTPSPAILLNTYGEVSTDTLELFYDENYRLKETASGVQALSGISGTGRGTYAWDSTDDLNFTPALQVINGTLIYPQDDFSTAAPSGSPDYSALGLGVGDLVYTRRFKDPIDIARSNGVLRIDGLSEADRLAGNILIDIRVVGTHIPGNGLQGVGNEGTGWLSLNTGYNSATFEGDDGDGCFVTVQGYSAPFFEFTLGGFSTAYAGNKSIEMRVTFKDPAALAKKITRIQIIDWT